MKVYVIEAKHEGVIISKVYTSLALAEQDLDRYIAKTLKVDESGWVFWNHHPSELDIVELELVEERNDFASRPL